VKPVRALLCAALLALPAPPRAEAGGRAVWRVKVVTPRGDVRIVLVDVATGQAR